MSSLGAEVGSGHVSIFPVMDGFRSKVTAEVRGTATESGNLFQRLFKRSGDESGRQLGKGVKQALEQSVRGLKVPALDRLRDDLTKVRRESVSAYDRMRESTARADAAQAKYNETVEKYGQDSSRAKSAQAALVAAQDRAREASDKYSSSQERLKSVQEQVNAAERLYRPAQYEHAAAQVKQLTAAKESEQKVYDRASKVERKAQEALSKAIQRHGADSRQAQKAQEALSKAMMASRPAAEAMRNVTQKLTEAQQQLNKVAKGYKAPDTSKAESAFARLRERVRQLGSMRLGGLRSEMSKTGQAGESMGSRIKAGTIALGTAVGNAVSGALSTIKGFAQDCVNEYNEASEGVAKFNQIAANNDWSEAQKQSLDELSESLMHVGVIDDDVTRAGQAQLGTFKLSAQAVRELTPAMDDMVAHTKGLNASSQDAVTIGNLMGKVMTGSVTALQRYGVTMDANQKKLLQHGTAEQRAAELAKVLEQNYGGVNKALAQTPAGKIKQMRLNVDDLKKSLGRSFTTVVGAIAPTITAGLNKAQKPVERFAKWFTSAIKGLSDVVRTGSVSKEMERAFGVDAKPIVGAINDIKAGFSDAWGGIKRGLSDVAGSAGKAHDKVSPLADIIKILGKVVRTAGSVVGVLASHLKGLLIVGGIAVAVSGLVKAMSALKSAITAVRTAQTVLNAVMSADPIGLIITAVVAVIAGLAVLEKKFHIFEKAGDAIKKAWGGVSRFFQGLWSDISKWGQKAGKDIQKRFGDAQKSIQKSWNGMKGWARKKSTEISKGFQGFKKDVSKHFNDAQKSAQKTWNGMEKWASRKSSEIARAFSSLKQGVSSHFKRAEAGARNIWHSTPGWFRDSVVGRIISFYATLPGRIIGFFRHPAQSAKSIWTNVTSFFSGLPGRIAGSFASIPGRITGFFRSAGESVKGVWRGVVGFFRSIPGKIIGFFRSIPSKMGEIGRNIVEGLKNGITGSIGSVARVITGGMHNAIDSVKHALGIHSPSTVMRDQVGRFVGLGMAEGIRASMPAVAGAMDDMAMIPGRTRMSMPDMSRSISASYGLAGGGQMTHDDAVALLHAVEDLHRDLGPTISRWTPTMSGRERARAVRDALAGRY